MRSHLAKLGAVALMVAAVPILAPAPARACSYASFTIEASFPANGAVDVPTNGVLFLHGSIGLDAEWFTLTDGAGTEVPIEVSPAVPRGAIIRPVSELEPRERYELRLGYEYSGINRPSERLEFTTGAGPQAAGETPPAPMVRLRELDWPGACDPMHVLCVNGAAPTGYVMQVDAGNDLWIVHPAGEWPLQRVAYQDFPDDACIEVRLRGLLGDLSPATRLCGAEVERLSLPFPGYTSIYSCNDVDAVLQATSSNAPDAGTLEALPGDGGVSVASSELPASDLVSSAAPSAASAEGCSITSARDTTSRGWLGWGALALMLVARSSSRARRERRRG